MISRLLAAAALAGVATSGCATFPSVRETSTPCPDGDGLVVNSRASYSVTATIPDGSPLKGVDVNEKSVLTGVAHGSVLVLDVRRMPFGSGSLSVKLLPSQVPEEVAVVGESGAPGAAKTTQIGAETYQALEEARHSNDD